MDSSPSPGSRYRDGNNGFGADWHPNVKTHQIMADKLVETLKQDLKW